jgi:hypothetical protein
MPQGSRRSLSTDGARQAGAFSSDQSRDILSAFESSPGRVRRFCSVCGTHIVAERGDQPHVVLRVATLDDDPDVKPLVHIWTSHDVPPVPLARWRNRVQAIPSHGRREMEVQLFAKR